MRLFAFFILTGLLTGCGDGTHFTSRSERELDDSPVQQELEARRASRRKGGDSIIDLTVAGKRAGRRKPLDIHFYIGSHKPELSFSSLSSPSFNICLHNFGKHTKKTGFLSLLKGWDWQFSHSRFSASEGKPLPLERDGRYVSNPYRPSQFRNPQETVLKPHWPFPDDVFSFTLAPLINGSSLYIGHITSPQKDSTIYYDAPLYDHSIHRDGRKNPLVGLDDLLTNKYSAIRSKSQVEIFVATNHFPPYSPEDIQTFLKRHKGTRIHLLSSNPANTGDLGALIEIVQKSKGTANSLCSDEKIGLKLAEIINR